ncbi:MAG TPA: amino acid adenylation domain-containing protein, partial [Steroidobacteraceae bacterium]
EGNAYLKRAYEAPTSEIEIAIAGIWQDLLHLERVGRHDHFFELGGHSMLVVTFIARLHHLGLTLDVQSVFADPTLTAIAAVLAESKNGAPVMPAAPNLIPKDGASVDAITPAMLPLVTLTQADIDRIVATVPEGIANVQDVYPLAPLQEGILFHHLLEADSDPYLSRVTLAFDNRSQLDAFVDALQRVVNRHDILRTAIVWTGLSQPVQVVYRHARLPIEDLQPEVDGDALATLLRHTDPRRTRRDVQQAPLISLSRIPSPTSDKWLLGLLYHHMVLDHVTLDIVLEEIRALTHGHSDPLPPVVPYRNFVAQVHPDSVARHSEYFRAQLGDVDEPTSPFGILNVQNSGGEVQEAGLLLSDALAMSIREQASRLGVSPAVLFHVAWAQVVAHCSGRHDVVFGTVLLGRLQGARGVNRALGVFINTLPVRIPLGSRSAREVVNDTYKRLSTLLVHEQASLTLAQQCSGVHAPLPLFTALLNYRHSHEAPTADSRAPGPVVEGVSVLSYEERTNYPISLSVDDRGQEFAFRAQCVAGLDPARIVEYMRNAAESLVAALAEESPRPVLSLSIMSAAERQQLLFDWNATDSAHPNDRLIHSLVEAHAAARPEAPALMFEHQSLSYGQLNAKANQLAHHLLSVGIRPDDRIALCIERGLDMVIGLLGILKAGAAYVPLDPEYPSERLGFMLADCAPRAVLTQTALQGLFPAVTARVIALDESTTQAAIAQHSCANPDPAALGLTPQSLAYVIYTSGSSGQPKGVMVEHRHLVASTLARMTTAVSYQRFLLLSSIAFDSSVAGIFGTLSTGGALVVLNRSSARDPQAVQRAILNYHITALLCVPSLAQLILDHLTPDDPPADLETLIVAGESCSPTLREKIKAFTRPIALYNEYGPTETTVWATAYRCEPDDEGAIPIGRPIANTKIYLLDAYRQPVPIGVPGEIYIGGAQVARGYLGRPDLTQERFLPDPFSAAPHARMYKTGDLGRYLPDGNLVFLGRNDSQVKIRGYRIEPGEIEAHLLACPGVRAAAVIAREDRLVAYVVPEERTELSVEHLRARLASELAEYMVPAAYVVLPSLPLTPNGKLDRRALPAPEADAYLKRAYEAPVGEVEIAIASIWRDLLKIQQVGRHDHFFELGGHSLLAVQLISRLRQVLGADVALPDLFATPTLSAFAKRVAAATAPVLPPIQRADRTQRLPLSWSQQRLWFLAQLDPAAGAAYHMPAALRLRGPLDRAALTETLHRIVARHEILRTTFVKTAEGEPIQVIAPVAGGFALSCEDLRNLAEIEQQAHVARASQEEFRRPFDLSRGPLIRGRLLQLADDEHTLLFCQHHIISDGWSVAILVREITTLYAAFSRKLPDPLPPLDIQYADYAVWQRRWLQGETLQTQVDFWRNHLTGAPALLELPTDHPRPALQSYAGASIPLVLPADLTAGLKALSQRHGTTLFMTLFAGWSILLARLSSQNDLVVGTSIANRQRLEIEPLVGFFVNMMALRIRLEDDPTVSQLLARVKSITLAAYAHQDVPFEQVVEAVQPVRALSHSPLFQALLALVNTPESDTQTLPGLELTPLPSASTTTHFDLSLMVSDTGALITGELQYVSELFDPATIERLAGHFCLLLRAMLADDQQRISLLPLLSPAQRQQLLVEWNATAAPYGVEPAHRLFEAQAAAHPDATALRYQELTLSYA